MAFSVPATTMPAAPSNLAVTPSSDGIVETLTPTVKATLNDPAGKNVRVKITVRNDESDATVYTGYSP